MRFLIKCRIWVLRIKDVKIPFIFFFKYTKKIYFPPSYSFYFFNFLSHPLVFFFKLFLFKGLKLCLFSILKKFIFFLSNKLNRSLKNEKINNVIPSYLIGLLNNDFSFFNFNFLFLYIYYSFNIVFNFKVKKNFKKNITSKNVNYLVNRKKISYFFRFLKINMLFELKKSYFFSIFFMLDSLFFNLKNSFFYEKKKTITNNLLFN